MAGGSAHPQDPQGLQRAHRPRPRRRQARPLLRRPGHRLLAHLAVAVKAGLDYIEPQRPNTIARSLAIGNPADGPAAARMIRSYRRLGRRCLRHRDRLRHPGARRDRGHLHRNRRRRHHRRHRPPLRPRPHPPGRDHRLCITGNGLKTTDALAGRYTRGARRPSASRRLRRLPRASSTAASTEPELVTAGGALCRSKSYSPPPSPATPTARSTSAPPPQTCPALLADIDQHFPALGTQIKDDSGKLRRFINIYINDEDIRFLGGDSYAFQDGDEVMLIPSIAGGS